jgi:hypothetical protein
MKFFKKNNKIVARVYSDKELVEIHEFHLMLIKMKKRHPNLDEKILIDLIYPNNNIDFK